MYPHNLTCSITVASPQANLNILEAKLTFSGVTEAELRKAVGEKILGYLEDGGKKPVVFALEGEEEIPNPEAQRQTKNVPVPTFRDLICQNAAEQDMDARAQKAMSGSGGVYSVTSARPSKGAACTIMALLLRCALEDSYASPAEGPDAQKGYIHAPAFRHRPFVAFTGLIIASPIIIDLIESNGKCDINGWGVALCISSILQLHAILQLQPRGFVKGALHSIRRRAHLLCFLNSLLLKSHHDNEDGEWSYRWPFQMDLSNPENFQVWALARGCAMLYGDSYKTRTDLNGGLMILYVAIITVAMMGFTAINGEKLYAGNYMFPLALHFSFVFLMASFSVHLSMEGHKLNEMALRSKMVLSAAMLRVEARAARTLAQRHHPRDDPLRFQLETCRFAAGQVHESLSTSKDLHGTSVLDLFDLDKSLVLTVVFAAVTQFTLIMENFKFVPT